MAHEMGTEWMIATQNMVNEMAKQQIEARRRLEAMGLWPAHVPPTRWQTRKYRVKRPFLWFFGLRIVHKNRIDNDW